MIVNGIREYQTCFYESSEQALVLECARLDAISNRSGRRMPQFAPKGLSGIAVLDNVLADFRCDADVAQHCENWARVRRQKGRYELRQYVRNDFAFRTAEP